MELTKQVLENYRTCNEGMLWYISNDEPDSVEETIEKLLSSDECEKFIWSNWLLSRVLPTDDKIRYAIFAAELVLDIFEKEFPEDKRPRNAIESARGYLLHKDVTAAGAARDAANASYAASYAASRAAADAAAEAACAAAEATYTTCAHYADADADVADESAYAAAYAAARAAANAAADAARVAADAARVAASTAARAADDAAYAAARETYTKIINYGLSLLKSIDLNKLLKSK